MDRDPIGTIKQRLVEQPEEFDQTAMTFFSLFSSDDRFRGQGESVVDRRLSRLVEELSFREIGTGIRPHGFLELKEIDLLHGGFRVRNVAASVFYFSDIGVGVLYVSRDRGRKSHSRMVRFEGEFASLPDGGSGPGARG